MLSSIEAFISPNNKLSVPDVDFPLSPPLSLNSLFDKARAFAIEVAHKAALRAAQEYVQSGKDYTNFYFVICFNDGIETYSQELSAPRCKLADALESFENQLIIKITRDVICFVALAVSDE